MKPKRRKGELVDPTNPTDRAEHKLRKWGDVPGQTEMWDPVYPHALLAPLDDEPEDPDEDPHGDKWADDVSGTGVLSHPTVESGWIFEEVPVHRVPPFHGDT